MLVEGQPVKLDAPLTSRSLQGEAAVSKLVFVRTGYHCSIRSSISHLSLDSHEYYRKTTLRADLGTHQAVLVCLLTRDLAGATVNLLFSFEEGLALRTITTDYES